MQGRHALQALGQPPRCEALALLVHEVDIVMAARNMAFLRRWLPRRLLDWPRILEPDWRVTGGEPGVAGQS